MSFDDLTPENTITGATDETLIGNENDQLKVALKDDVHNKDLGFTAFGGLKTFEEVILGDFRLDREAIKAKFDVERGNDGRFEIVGNETGAVLKVFATGDSIHLQSKERMKYQSGHGIQSKQSIIMGDNGTAGVLREWGLKYEDNGFFFRLDGTTFSFVISRDGVETVVDASTWDIPTTFSGDGNIYYIQYEWLGVGNCYVYVGEQLCHTYNFLGTSKEFSVGTPDLKLHYLLDNVTNNTEVYMKMGCASVVSEGGANATRLDADPTGDDLARTSKSSIIGQSEDGHWHSAMVTERRQLLVCNEMDLVQFKEMMMCLVAIQREMSDLKNLMSNVFNEESNTKGSSI